MSKNISKSRENVARRREEFCQEYVSNGYDQAAAYAKVYDAPNFKTASSAASRLMKEPDVKNRINELIGELYESQHITAERIAMKLAEMAFAAKEDEVYGPSVALKALDMLQKQLGLQKQKIDADVNAPTTIKVSIKPKEEIEDEGQTGNGA